MARSSVYLCKCHPMKTQLITAAMLAICAFSACRKCEDHVDPPVSCESVFCTMNFASVGVRVVDAAAQPVKLDSFVVVDMNGVPLPLAVGGTPVFGPSGDNGYYSVLTDAWRTGHENTTVKVRALGYRGNVEVLNQVYEIATDCCHVSKVSGQDTVMVN